MRVALGSDHAGVHHKDAIVLHLMAQNIDVTDFGPITDKDSVDYPDYALTVARAVADGEADFGILVCGTGIGMAIAANKIDNVRAANILRPDFAVLTRQHNNANVLTLSGRFVELPENLAIVDAFLSTPFEGGRHQNRLDKITQAEGN